MNRFVIVIFLLLLTGTIFAWLQIAQLNDTIDSNNNAFNDSIRCYEDKYKDVVFEKNSYVVDNKELKSLVKRLRVDIKNIKPEVIIKYETKYKDTTITKIIYETIIPYEFSVPFKYKSKWLSLTGLSSNKGLTLYDKEFYNTQTLDYGFKRKNIFSPYYASVRIKNENPYVRVTSMESYRIKRDKHFYETNLFWGVVGTAVGIIIIK